MNPKLALLLLSFIIITPKAFASDHTCPQRTYLVHRHPRQAYYRNDGTYVSSTTISSYCKNYRDDGSLKTIFLKRMPKRWPHKNEQFKKCSQKKQRQISKILSSIPKVLTSVGKLKIYCGKKSYIANNPAASAPTDKIIILYDQGFQMDTKRIVIHELAHILWNRLSDQEKNSYQHHSHWSLVHGVYIHNRTSFSESDGKNSPEEDFANNVEHYFANHENFKKNFPRIYGWINKFTKENK